jgi:hypothetical protein
VINEMSPPEAELVARADPHADRVLASDARSTELLCEQIVIAQAALTEADGLLRPLTVGGTGEGALSGPDYLDACNELINARRALRHLARIAEGHADVLAELTTLAPGAAEDC